MLDRVYRAVAWQGVNQIWYSIDWHFFQVFDIHSTIIEIDAFILPVGVFIQSGSIVFSDKMLECFVNWHFKWL
jgi:hypothetical protein